MSLVVLGFDLFLDAAVRVVVDVVFLQVGQDDVSLFGFLGVDAAVGHGGGLEAGAFSLLEELEVLVAHEIDEDVFVLLRLLRVVLVAVKRGKRLVQKLNELQIRHLSPCSATDVF